MPTISTPCTTSSVTTIYQRAYEEQPYLFQDGANDGFHEAIGDFVGLVGDAGLSAARSA